MLGKVLFSPLHSWFLGPGSLCWYTLLPSKAFACDSLSQNFGVEPPPEQNVYVYSSVLPKRPLLLAPKDCLLHTPGTHTPPCCQGRGVEN